MDEALIRHSSLFTTMVTARRETGSGSFTGHEALLRLAKSQQALLEAGSNLAQVHGSLLEVQKELLRRRRMPAERAARIGRRSARGLDDRSKHMAPEVVLILSLVAAAGTSAW